MTAKRLFERLLLRSVTVAALSISVLGCSGEAPEGADEPVGEVVQRACNNDGTCEPGESYLDCGDCYCYPDGYCDSPSETAISCPDDCSEPPGPCDNDGNCESAQGETSTNCPNDCFVGPPNPCDNDGTCEKAQGETFTNCGGDCYCYPDGYCDAPSETKDSCPQDCETCGNGVCEPPGETYQNCGSDCYCYPDGNCDAPSETKESCPVDCNQCGNGTCEEAAGEDCWTCSQDCPNCTSCGDGTCDAGETTASCPGDCPPPSNNNPVCGDGTCEAAKGETSTSCPSDCGSNNNNNDPGACCTDAAASSDPCGWRDDGYCDTGCTWGEDTNDCNQGGGGTGGGGSGGAGGGPPNPPTPPPPAGCNGKCTCPTNNVVPDAYSVGFEKHWDIGGQCPVIGGKAGTVVDLAGSAEYEALTCKQSGDSASYDTKFAVGAELGLTVDLCNQYTFNIKGGGEYHAERSYGTTCNEQTCNYESTGQYCGKQGFKGHVSMGLSRFMGYKKRWKAPGAGIRPSIGLLVNCGVTVGGTVSVSGGQDTTVNGGLDGCVDCKTSTATFGGTLSGTGGCGIKATIGKFSKKFGCSGCGTVGVSLEGANETTTGSCGAKDCKSLEFGVNAGFNSGCIAAGFGWFKIGVQCSASAGGKKKWSTCGSTPFTPDASKIGCNVVGKGSNACKGK